MNKKEFQQKHQTLLKRQEALGIKTVFLGEDDYPKSLQNMPNPPQALHYLGNIRGINERVGVAIIGMRKAENCALHFAENVAFDLGRKDSVNIVSGLALGCDTAAHIGCLNAGGFTTAVVACGLDIVHPRANEVLQNDIIRLESVVVSEYFIGTKAHPKNLIARNRIQVGLSKYIIVAQAILNCGTMNTVSKAIEHNREIFVFNDASFEGNQMLIKEQLAKAYDSTSLPFKRIKFDAKGAVNAFKKRFPYTWEKLGND